LDVYGASRKFHGFSEASVERFARFDDKLYERVKTDAEKNPQLRQQMWDFLRDSFWSAFNASKSRQIWALNVFTHLFQVVEPQLFEESIPGGT
jgi:hypothetical protein